MRLILLAILLLTSTPLWACSSYEECIWKSHKSGWEELEKEKPDILITQAIAYKLDEISKKLGTLPDVNDNTVHLDYTNAYLASIDSKLDRLPEPNPFQQMASKASRRNET